MELPRFEQIRHALHRREYAIAAGLIAAAFLLATLVGGYALFRRALDDNRPPSASVMNVPTRIGLLFSYDEPRDVLNHIVFFNDVRLEPGPSDDLYYAVGANGNRVLVASNGKKRGVEGAEVDLKGTVRSLPAASTLKTKWKLNKDELSAVRKQGIYIEAEEIKVQHRPAASVARK